MFIDRRRNHRQRRRLLGWWVAVSVLACVAACTPGEADAPPVRTVVEKVWTAVGIDPVSPVTNVAGVALVYGTTPKGLEIYALDPATGEVWWQRPAVQLAEADTVVVAEIDQSVAYFRPTDDDRVSQLVIADPKSGADLTVSAARYWASYPQECDDDTGWACLASYTQSADGHWHTHPFRVERDTGKTLTDVRSTANVPDGAYEIPYVNLFYSYPDGEDASMGRFVGGKEEWSKPAAEIFGSDIPSPRQFWFHDPRGRDYAMFTAISPGTEATSGRTLDLSKDIAAAVISIADGTVTWTRPGSWEGCGLQPLLDWDPDAPGGEPNAYVCHYTGSAVWDPNPTRADQIITTHLSVTMDRVEAATGAVMWSTKLGDAKALIADATGEDLALLDDKHLLVPNSAGGLVIDLESGQTRQPAADDVFWCTKRQTFPRPGLLYVRSSPVKSSDRIGVVQPCRADGEDAPVPRTIPAKIGESFDGDLRVLAMADAVVGFLVPPPAPDDSDTATSGAESSSADTSSAASSSAASDAETDSADPAFSSAATAPEKTPAKSEQVSNVKQVWATKGFSAKTTPTIIGGTAVLYGTVGTDLFLIGLDPATGAERWRHSASAAAFSPNQEVKVVEIDGQVAFLRPGVPSPSTLAQIVLIDAASGAEKLATEQRWWTEFPTACPDDKAFLCAPAKYVGSDHILSPMNFRINRSTGAVTLGPDDAPGATEPYTTLWNHLVAITGAPVETIGVVEDDQLLWSQPLSELLGQDATLDHGWYASEDDGTKDVLQLSATVGWTSDGTTYPALDLAKNLVTVGLNRRDGTVLWRQPGTSPQCRYLLPGPVSVSTPGSKNPALRCRYAGRLDSTPAGRSYGLTVPTDLSVTIERVDLQTGQAIWSAPVGPVLALAMHADGLAVAMLDDHRILVSGQLIDLDDGSTSSLAAGETVWCPGPQAFEQAVEWFGADGSVRTDRRAEGGVYPCGGDGKPSSKPSAGVPLAISTVTDDGLRLVSTPSGVLAFRVAP